MEANEKMEIKVRTVWFAETSLENGRRNDSSVELRVAEGLFDGVVAGDGDARRRRPQVETHNGTVNLTQFLERFVRERGIVAGQERNVTHQRQSPRSCTLNQIHLIMWIIIHFN